MVSNPPYGIRLKDEDLEKLYYDIASLFNKNKELK
jgi:23S rRNA G2445 N2-methylase RlmL